MSLWAGVLLCLAPAIALAKTLPAPVAAFDAPTMVSLSAAPVLTGSSSNLLAPLYLSVTPRGALTTSFAAGVAENGAFRLRVYPAIPVGTYAAALSSQGQTLATSTLYVGVPAQPQVDLDPMPAWDAADGALLHLRVYARGGDVTLGQLAFTFATSSADISGVSLAAFMDSGYTQPIAAASSTNGTVGTLADPVGGLSVLTLDPPLTVPAGQTYFLALTGTVVPSDTSYSAEAMLVGDTGTPEAGTKDALASSTNFLWSPFGADPASAIWLDGVSGGVPMMLVQTRQNAPVPTVPTCALTAASSTMAAGSTTTLTWSTSALSLAHWEDGSGAALSGTRTIVVSGTHTYILFGAGNGGTTQCFVTVSVPSAPPPLQPPVLGTLSATPTSGTATLSVTFQGSVNLTSSCAASTYTLAYGDGAASIISVPTKLCKPQSYRLSHSYSKTGTFIAVLSRNATASSTVQTVATQTIIVRGRTGFVSGTTQIASVIAAFFSIFAWWR